MTIRLSIMIQLMVIKGHLVLVKWKYSISPNWKCLQSVSVHKNLNGTRDWHYYETVTIRIAINGA